VVQWLSFFVAQGFTMKRRTLIQRGMSSAFTASWVGMPVATLAQAKTWKIARVLPLTGSNQSYGQAKRDGGDAFAAMVNAKGGIAGRQLEWLTADDGYVEATTVAKVTELSAQKPVAFAGFFGAPHCVVAAKALGELGQVGVGFTTGSNAFRTQMLRHVFPVRASFAQEAAGIVRHMITLGQKSASVAFVNIPFGQLAKASFEAAAKEQSLQLGSPAEVKPDGSNAAEAAAALKNAPVVLLALHTPAAIAQVRALRGAGAGVGGQQIWCLSAVDTLIMGQALKEASRGVSTAIVVPSPNKTSVPIVREYLMATKAINKPASLYGMEAFIETKTLAAGLARSKGDSPAAVIAAMETLSKLDLGGYEISYAPDHRIGSRFVDLAIVSGQRVVG
jgi:branched-chain amino acid transport system substrate-binding protein